MPEKKRRYNQGKCWKSEAPIQRMIMLSTCSPGCSEVLLQGSSPQSPSTASRLLFNTEQESIVLASRGTCLSLPAHLGTVLAVPCDEQRGFWHI